MREVLSLATSPGGGGGGDGPPPANDNQTVDDSNNNDSVVIAEDSGNSSGDFMSSVGSDCDDGSSCAEDVTKSEDSASLEVPAAPIDTASAPEPVKMLSSQPGYLELGEDRAKELLSDRPIEELYEVEDQPFARGKYATVRRCRCRRTGQQFAAKVVRKRRRSTDLRAEILHEVAVLDACRGCPRIVRLHRVFESPSDMVLLLELAAGGELQMVLDRDEVPEEREAARLMRQILHGLVFLHDINVAHLDLKPQNLVLTGDFPDCDVKLCDFGISRYLSQGADVREILGTPDYVAPEVLNYEPISLATDMWSVGVLLYVLLTGCSPFGGETKQETFCNISQCRLDFPDDLFEDVSDDAKDLMRKLIVKDPKRRLSANDCLQHQWFTAQPSPLAAQPVLVAGSPCASPTLARRHSVAATPSPPSSPPPSLPPPLPATPPPNVAATPSPQAPPRRGSLDWRRHRDSASVDRDRLCLSGPAVRRLASADSLDSLDRLAPARAHSTPHRSGISDVRRDTFLRNMESIARRLSVPGEADTAARAADTAESSDRTFRTRATGMQTMPLRGVRGVARAFEAFEASAQVTAHGSPRCAGTVAHPGLAGLAGLGLTASAVDLRSDKEAVFKFRKVFVLEDEDLDALTHLPSINGSTGSASSGSSVYSDTSISDSNSDTVSELSVDSSSDRSSIISLDPDDQYPWDVAYARFGLGRLYHPSYNVWERARPSGATRLLPRECNGSFARALSRFATESDESGRSKTSSRTAPDGMRQRPGLGGLSKPVLSKLALMQTAMSNGKRCGLELMREKNGNLVVIREIREVKPGGRYARFSEVKCESVQSRIRKLQVQGAKS